MKGGILLCIISAVNWSVLHLLPHSSQILHIELQEWLRKSVLSEIALEPKNEAEYNSRGPGPSVVCIVFVVLPGALLLVFHFHKSLYRKQISVSVLIYVPQIPKDTCHSIPSYSEISSECKMVGLEIPLKKNAFDMNLLTFIPFDSPTFSQFSFINCNAVIF